MVGMRWGAREGKRGSEALVGWVGQMRTLRAEVWGGGFFGGL